MAEIIFSSHGDKDKQNLFWQLRERLVKRWVFTEKCSGRQQLEHQRGEQRKSRDLAPKKGPSERKEMYQGTDACQSVSCPVTGSLCGMTKQETLSPGAKSLGGEFATGLWCPWNTSVL